MPTHSYLPIEKQHVNMENMKQKWYRPNIDPKVLKELMKRKDLPGLIKQSKDPSYFISKQFPVK